MRYNPPPFPEPSRPPGAWTLATYNVQDLFDLDDDPRASEPVMTENRLQNKLTRLARVLHVLDADVIGLMEVETLGVLRRLRDEALPDLGYREAILIEGNDPERGIDVALLSRFPVVETVSHAAETYLAPDGERRRIFSRDCLECRLRLPDGQTAVVLVNHFKSKRGGAAETAPLRARQALRVQMLAEDRLRLFPLVAVIGDLNDTADSPALRPLIAPSHGPALPDLAAEVPAGSCYTFVHAGRSERIDYLLASPALAARLVPNSVLIPHDVFAARASDHVPVRAAFVLGGSAVPPYPQSLTAVYEQTHRVVRRGHVPPRIDAARFHKHDLDAWIGQTVIVTGVVRRVEVTRGTGVVRLLLGHGDWGRAFQATIFPEAREAFAAAGIRDIDGYYQDRLVQGVGRLDFYQGVPEIAVETPHQLRPISRKDLPS